METLLKLIFAFPPACLLSSALLKERDLVLTSLSLWCRVRCWQKYVRGIMNPSVKGWSVLSGFDPNFEEGAQFGPSIGV